MSKYSFFSKVALVTMLLHAFVATQAMADDTQINTLSGPYKVVDVRRSSDVIGSTEDPSVPEDALGRSVMFGKQLTWWNGQTCDNWEATQTTDLVGNVDDPNLSDTQIGPIEGQRSTGDKRVNEHLVITCDGNPFAPVIRIDSRILVAPSPSGLSYVLLERELEPTEIERLQTELVSMKYLEAEPADSWNEDSLSALGFYADYRGSAYRFHRTAVTANLLDGLGVLKQGPGGHGVVKIVYADDIAAYFYGEEVELGPRNYGVRKLAFRFKDDTREYRFQPAGELFDTDWQFDLFSHERSYVLLLQDHYGPYHVVRAENLQSYLSGEAPPDFIVDAEPKPASLPKSVLSRAEWISDTSFEFTEACCGEEYRRTWSVDIAE